MKWTWERYMQSEWGDTIKTHHFPHFHCVSLFFPAMTWHTHFDIRFTLPDYMVEASSFMSALKRIFEILWKIQHKFEFNPRGKMETKSFDERATERTLEWIKKSKRSQ